MTTLHFRIPQSVYLSQNDRQHFRAKASKTATLRHLAFVQSRGLPPVTTPCVMDVDIGWPDKRRRDRSNAASSIKALVDGLVPHLIEDDSDSHITAETYRSHVEGDRGFIHIQITFSQETS